MFSVASFFAGVGGIDLGFEETGEFKLDLKELLHTISAKFLLPAHKACL